MARNCRHLLGFMPTCIGLRRWEPDTTFEFCLKVLYRGNFRKWVVMPIAGGKREFPTVGSYGNCCNKGLSLSVFLSVSLSFTLFFPPSFLSPSFCPSPLLPPIPPPLFFILSPSNPVSRSLASCLVLTGKKFDSAAKRPSALQERQADRQG